MRQSITLYPINNALSSLRSLHDAIEKNRRVQHELDSISPLQYESSNKMHSNDRGVISVAASGNGGVPYTFEKQPFQPEYFNVISVGSHDGGGNKSMVTNSPTGVHILANGRQIHYTEQ